MVSGSSWPLGKLVQDLKGQSEAKAIWLFLEGWYSVPDMVAAHTCCLCLPALSAALGTPTPTPTLAPTRSALSVSLLPKLGGHEGPSQSTGFPADHLKH